LDLAFKVEALSYQHESKVMSRFEQKLVVGPKEIMKDNARTKINKIKTRTKNWFIHLPVLLCFPNLSTLGHSTSHAL